MATIAAAGLTDLGALAAEHAAAGDAERRLARPVVEALREAGLFRALVPAGLGGLESEPQDFLDALRGLLFQRPERAFRQRCGRIKSSVGPA